MSAPEAILRWYGVLLIATVAFAPWVRLVCAWLPDRGAAVTRPLALLGAIFPLWFLAGLDLLPYSTLGLWITIAVAGLAGWTVVFVRGAADRAWLRSLLVVELLAVAVFFGYVWLRGLTPNIDLTEKTMDIALLSASARAEAIPPDDPWFAGEPINYYYLGYLLHGSVGRLAGVPTPIGFNLALATTGSMAFVAAAGLGFNALRRWGGRRLALLAAGAAAFLLVIAGNLYAPQRLLQDPRATVDAWWWNQQEGIGWRSSRIVCDGVRVDNDCPDGIETINEFPAFSLLLGDLHPHVMALPFTIVALTLALNLVFLGSELHRMSRRRALAVLAVTGAATGALYALNSWDYPTFLLITLIAGWFGFRELEVRERFFGLAIVAITSIAAWLPFYLNFSAPIGSGGSDLPTLLQDIPLVSTVLTTLAPFQGERTSAGEFLTVFGVPFVVALWLLATGFNRDAEDPVRPNDADAPSPSDLPLKPLAPFLVVGVLVGLLLPAPLLILCGGPLLLALVQLSQMRTLGPRLVATALFASGFALLIATEFFYIQDLFGHRMNTVFKVYYQVWTLFAVAAALAIVAIMRETRVPRLMRPAMASFLVVAALAGLTYPTVAYYQWTERFGDWRGLDGMAFLARETPDERAAIAWLQDHATADDVLLEAAGCSYDYVGQLRHNRASAFSGVPTVIGWGWHETQWRNGQLQADQIRLRQADVRAMFADPRSPLYDLYGVTLLYVGSLERNGDLQCRVLAEPYEVLTPAEYIRQGWEEVFSRGDVAIYRRAGSATASSGG